MNLSGRYRWEEEIRSLGSIVLGLGLLSRRAGSAGNGSQRLKVTIREWDVPQRARIPMIRPLGRTARCGSRNRWLTVGRLDPATGTFKEFPSSKEKIRGRTGSFADKDGNIWYTANFAGYIGKLDPRTER